MKETPLCQRVNIQKIALVMTSRPTSVLSSSSTAPTAQGNLMRIRQDAIRLKQWSESSSSSWKKRNDWITRKHLAWNDRRVSDTTCKIPDHDANQHWQSRWRYGNDPREHPVQCLFIASVHAQSTAYKQHHALFLDGCHSLKSILCQIVDGWQHFICSRSEAHRPSL